MNKIQKLYIKILEPVSGFLDRTPLGIKGRETGISICAFLLSFFLLLQFPYKDIYWPALRYPNNATLWTLAGSLVLIAVIMLAAEREMKPIKINKAFCLFYFGTALLIFISGFMHYIDQGWRPFTITMLLVFPVFYFISVNTKCSEIFFKAFSWGLIIGGCVISIASLIASPPDLSIIARYSGINVNSAHFAICLLPSVIGCLYIAITSRIAVIRIVAWIIVWLPVSMMFLAGTRSPLIAAVMAIIAAVIIIVRKRKAEARKKTNMGIVIAIVAGVLLFLFISDAGNIIIERLARFDVTDKTVNQVLSGRWNLWIETINNLNFIGHDYRTDPLIINETYMFGTHNFTLEVAYRSGIIAGIFYLLMEVSALIFVFKKLFSKKTFRKEYVFACLIIPAFFVVSMFEWDLLPFSVMYVLCFFLSLGPLMFEKDYDSENHDIIT